MIHDFYSKTEKTQYVFGNVVQQKNKAYKADRKAPKPHTDEELRAKRQQKSYPIKHPEDMQKLLDYFISKKRYRDYALFIIGCNTGVRCGDLVRIKWEDVLYNDVFKDHFEMMAQKTGKPKLIYLSAISKNALEILLQHTRFPQGYIFKSQRAPHINTRGVNTMLKKAAKKCKIPFRVGTHSMRKTYSYHWIMLHNNNQEALILLQDELQHSSQAYTLSYSGMTEDIKTAWKDDISDYMTSKLKLL